jgi:hypothetical protein
VRQEAHKMELRLVSKMARNVDSCPSRSKKVVRVRVCAFRDWARYERCAPCLCLAGGCPPKCGGLVGAREGKCLKAGEQRPLPVPLLHVQPLGPAQRRLVQNRSHFLTPPWVCDCETPKVGVGSQNLVSLGRGGRSKLVVCTACAATATPTVGITTPFGQGRRRFHFVVAVRRRHRWRRCPSSNQAERLRDKKRRRFSKVRTMQIHACAVRTMMLF